MLLYGLVYSVWQISDDELQIFKVFMVMVVKACWQQAVVGNAT
jgi:hypothetical protein